MESSSTPMRGADMPSYADLELWRNQNLHGEYIRLLKAVERLYVSIEHLDVIAAVDQTPNMLINRMCTLACLIGMGYGDPDIRAKIIAKAVEMRLAS